MFDVLHIQPAEMVFEQAPLVVPILHVFGQLPPGGAPPTRSFNCLSVSIRPLTS